MNELLYSMVEFMRNDLIQIVHRPVDVVRDRHTAELLKIEQAGIPPQNGIGTLLPQLMLHHRKPHAVHKRLHLVPCLLKFPDLPDARIPVMTKRIP